MKHPFDKRVESKAVQLMYEIEKQGVEVKRGYFELWTIEDCEYTDRASVDGERKRTYP